MDVTPSEAEEALTAIRGMVAKTRRVISGSGAHRFLIVWGSIWLLGFLGSQFLLPVITGYSWIVLDTLGGILSVIFGIRMARGVRTSSFGFPGKRIGIFWLLLFLFCVAAVAVSWTGDFKRMAMLIVLFVMLGWTAAGLLLYFAPVWPGLILAFLALIGFFLLPGIFYLWMAFLGGGGMIALGLYIRNKW